MDVNGQNNLVIWKKLIKMGLKFIFVILIFIIPYNNVNASLNTTMIEEENNILKDESKENINLNNELKATCEGIAFLSNPSKGGYLTSYFGEVRAKSVHKGIDIAKNLGENVNAALGGTVINAGYNEGGYGNLIIIEHSNNMKTYYAHLSEIYVKTGDIVNQDDVIGAVGSTGNSTGPHLHFELRVDDNPIDPVKYIKE